MKQRLRKSLAAVAHGITKALRFVIGVIWDAGFSRISVNGFAAQHVAAVKNRLARVTLLVGGATVLATGVILTVKAAVGVGPVDVFITGLASTTGVSLAVAGYLYLAASTAAVLLFGRRPTIGGMALSAGVSAWFFVLPGWIVVPEGFVSQWLFFSAGLILLVLGVEMAAAAGFGRGNAEIVAEAAAEKAGCSVRLARTVLELATLAIGASLGGGIGAGTVVTGLAIGPMLQVVSQAVTDYRMGRSLRRSSSSDGESVWTPDTVSNQATNRDSEPAENSRDHMG